MEEDTRHIDQIVWLFYNGFKPLKITKIFKSYVECSDGNQYNLKSGKTDGIRRAYKVSNWDVTPSITTDDCSAQYESQRQHNQYSKLLKTVIGSINKDLTYDQLLQIQLIINQ
jgi:hypothetical protein